MSVQEWAPKDKLSAQHLNEMVRGINSVFPMTSGTGIQVSHFGNGVSVALDQSNTLYFTPEIGKIVDTGPNGQSDYTNYQYFVNRYQNINTAATNPLSGNVDLQPVPNCAAGSEETMSIVTAFNLSEYDAGTHTLAVDGSQWVILLPIRCDAGIDAAPRTRYLIVSGASSGVAADSTGQYQGQVHQQLSDLVSGWDYPLAVSI